MTGSVAVIDYGMGNLHSVASALEHAGAERVVVSCDAAEISAADRVVFPGVGAIRDCMAEIRRLRCDELLMRALTDERKPVLAICVGMQALMERSEENDGVDCLGLIPGEVRFFGHPLAMPGTAPEGAAHGLERGAAGSRASPLGRYRR